MKKAGAFCLGLWLVIVEVPGIHPGACFKNPDGPGWVSFVAALLPLVLTALAPEDRCLGDFPVGCHDVEVFPVDHLPTGDQVAAVAATE